LSTIDVLSFRDRDEWRCWLVDNHSAKDEAWIYIIKKRSKEVGLRLDEAVDEAKRSGMWNKAYTSKVRPIIPEDLAKALRLNPPAIDNFMRLSNSAKLQLIM
jgi:uncharacterized protein YdeI (YjbR/CyaY-like superfamily)